VVTSTKDLTHLKNKKQLLMNSDKFIKFWRKYGPYFLFGTGFIQSILLGNWAVGSLFIILGIMLITEND
jgi:hypothetical protein